MKCKTILKGDVNISISKLEILTNKVLQLGLIGGILYVGIVGFVSWKYAGTYLGCTVTLILVYILFYLIKKEKQSSKVTP